MDCHHEREGYGDHEDARRVDGVDGGVRRAVDPIPMQQAIDDRMSCSGRLARSLLHRCYIRRARCGLAP